jgi:hypothetical protein
MSDTSITPSIEVTIGRQTRLYHAFITTAPAALDAPSTLTLYAGPLKDVAGFAVDPVSLDARARRRRRAWSSSTPRNSDGCARAVDHERIGSRRPTQFWSASTRCSSGSGSGCRFRRQRWHTHEAEPLSEHEIARTRRSSDHDDYFAERVLPRASDLWIQASLEQRQRLQ